MPLTILYSIPSVKRYVRFEIFCEYYFCMIIKKYLDMHNGHKNWF